MNCNIITLVNLVNCHLFVLTIFGTRLFLTFICALFCAIFRLSIISNYLIDKMFVSVRLTRNFVKSMGLTKNVVIEVEHLNNVLDGSQQISRAPQLWYRVSLKPLPFLSSHPRSLKLSMNYKAAILYQPKKKSQTKN